MSKLFEKCNAHVSVFENPGGYFWGGGGDMQQVHAECNNNYFNIKNRQWFLAFTPSKAHRARL